MKNGVITVTALGALLLGVAAAGAADLTCTVSQNGGTFDDVVVPAGQSCVLNGVKVMGRVTVDTDAVLDVVAVSEDTTIGEGIKADGCQAISLEGDTSAEALPARGRPTVN